MIETERGPLPIHFVTIVVKAGAVDMSFPGCREDFIRAHDPVSYNGALFCISAMAPESVEWHLTRLEAAGIILGVDAALADMTHGPDVECPGLVFACEGEWFGARWSVDADAANDEPASAVQTARKNSTLCLASLPPQGPAQGREGSSDTTLAPWKRHGVPGGLVFWFGGGDDDD